MEKIAFSCVSSNLGFETQLFAASIRHFAGTLSDSPIWIFTPKSENDIPQNILKQFHPLNVKFIHFSVDPEIKKFPFATYVKATATVEEFSRDKTDILACLTPDTIIINDPKHLLLETDKCLGYRPVHHKLVGSVYREPIDPYWELIYSECNVSEDRIFPMKTHVDHHILRPYFNAGFLIVRPEKGLLQNWWDKFKILYPDPRFEKFYERNELYKIFIHQAVLAGVILSTMQRNELQELPFTYNYPLHLYHESPAEYQPKSINELITARYEELDCLEKVPIKDPLKSWIKKIKLLAQRNN